MRQGDGRLSEERQLLEQERQRKENQRLEMTNRLRQRQLISHESAYFSRVDVTEARVPIARARVKLDNSDRIAVLQPVPVIGRSGQVQADQNALFQIRRSRIFFVFYLHFLAILGSKDK